MVSMLMRLHDGCTGMTPPDADACFRRLKLPAEAILDHCHRAIDNPQQLWLPHYGFLAAPLGSDWITREPALRAVQQIAPIKQLGILKMPDHWVYHWHRDQNRQACINLLLSCNHHSHTLFGAPVSSTSMHCIELTYAPGRYYLFNNQIPHTVINLDVDRYLLSLEFERAIPYADLSQRLRAADLLDHLAC